MKDTPSDSMTIRTMDCSDVDIAICWAEKEGWNPGTDDAECFYEADPEGFFIREIRGIPVCCMSLVTYDENFTFGGFYIVNPKYRDKGYGSQMFSIAMAHAGTRNVGGDGVVEMHEK